VSANGTSDPEDAGPLPAMSTQLAAQISGPIAVRLSGLPEVEQEGFRARAAVSAAGASTDPAAPAGPGPGPIAPAGSGGPIAGVDTGGQGSGGAGSSGSSSSGIPPAVLLNPESAPLAFALSELTTPDRRITWWYPEVVVGPG
jgi:hypothetical protein